MFLSQCCRINKLHNIKKMVAKVIFVKRIEEALGVVKGYL